VHGHFNASIVRELGESNPNELRLGDEVLMKVIDTTNTGRVIGIDAEFVRVL